MSILALLLFFALTFGLGYSLTFFLKEESDWYEKLLIRICIGLGALPFLLVVLDFFHLPIDWKLVLPLVLIAPLWNCIKNRGRISLPKKAGVVLIVVGILFLFTLFMYVKGSFAYSYLEDDDPWAHTASITYVALEKNFEDPLNTFFYLAPYPPGFAGVFGLLRQTTPDLQWVMKFFNALIISLSIPLFFFFARRFTGSERRALAATVVLTAIPCYLSHFIWAHSLTMTAFIASLYTLHRMKDSWKWGIPTALIIAGICVTQPTKPIKFFFLYLAYLIAYSLIEKKISWKKGAAVAGGYVVSLIWWATNWKALLFKGTDQAVSAEQVAQSGGIGHLWELITKTFPPNSGTATRAYTFMDFFVARSQNMINNPIGVGWAISLLALLGLVLALLSFKKLSDERKSSLSTTLAWLVISFLAINTLTFHLPVGLFAFRWWMIFALPVSLLAAEGILVVLDLFTSFKAPAWLGIALIVFLLIISAGAQKYAVNTAQWGPGVGWTSLEEIQGFSYLKTLPPNTWVFSFDTAEPILGWNQLDCSWCPETQEFRKHALEQNTTTLHDWLASHGYQYVVLAGRTVKELEPQYGNLTPVLVNQHIDGMSHSPNFRLAHQTQGMVLFEVI